MTSLSKRAPSAEGPGPPPRPPDDGARRPAVTQARSQHRLCTRGIVLAGDAVVTTQHALCPAAGTESLPPRASREPRGPGVTGTEQDPGAGPLSRAGELSTGGSPEKRPAFSIQCIGHSQASGENPGHGKIFTGPSRSITFVKDPLTDSKSDHSKAAAAHVTEGTFLHVTHCICSYPSSVYRGYSGKDAGRGYRSGHLPARQEHLRHHGRLLGTYQRLRCCLLQRA